MGFCVNERKTIMKKKLGKTSEIRNAEEVQILYIFRIFKLFFVIVKNSFLIFRIFKLFFVIVKNSFLLEGL
jgi:hypothetical protein